MAFSDQAALAEDPNFRKKVRVALIFAGMNVMGEAKPEGMSDAKFGKRQVLAQSIVSTGGAAHIEAFSWLVSAFDGGIIQANASDNDIQFAVNSLMDDAAGVRSTD